MRAWMGGIVLGILPAALLPALPGRAVGLVMLACCLCLLRNWPGTCTRVAAGGALGMTMALFHGQALQEARLPLDCQSQPLVVTGEVRSLPRSSRLPDGTLRQRFEFAPETLEPAGCRGPRRLLLSYYGPQRILPGEHWRFSVRLKRPWGLANPGSFNMQAWFAGSGIDAVGNVPGQRAERLPAASNATVGYQRLRLDISDRIEGLDLPADTRAVLRALTVADKSGIDSRLWSALQQFGINHLLVISGLHVGLVAGAGFLLGNLLARPLLLAGIYLPWLPGVTALVLASAYAALAGFSLATQRALCMLACFIAASLAGRDSRSGNNLLAAACLVLCLNPLAGLGSGFWLSFGAVAALLWLAAWQGHAGIARRFVGTHVFMSVLMLPMSAWWFGGGSVLAACANALMIPLVGLVIVPLALLGVVAHLADWSLAPLFWRWAAWPLEHVLPPALELAAAEPGWLYRYFSSGPRGIVLAGLAVVVLVVPTGWPLRGLSLLLALPLLLPAEPAPMDEAGRTLVTVLDVGQGTAVVIRAAGRVMLYDTGGGDPAGSNMATSVILPYLRSLGIDALDTLVISHLDNDHSAGAQTLLRALPVRRLLTSQPLPGEERGERCISGQAWEWPGGPHFRFLSPALEGGLSSNNGSCVLLVDTGEHSLLLPGDIEHERERELVRYWREALRADWLLLAHHGSRTSSTTALIKTVQPQWTVVTSGYANRFGHPHDTVLQRVRRSGARLYDTAQQGALEFDFRPGEPPRISTHRARRQRYWM